MQKLKSFFSHALVFASGALPVVVALEAAGGAIGQGATALAGLISGVLSVVHRAAKPVG